MGTNLVYRTQRLRVVDDQGNTYVAIRTTPIESTRNFDGTTSERERSSIYEFENGEKLDRIAEREFVSVRGGTKYTLVD